jgi:hypothetical protein
MNKKMVILVIVLIGVVFISLVSAQGTINGTGFQVIPAETNESNEVLWENSEDVAVELKFASIINNESTDTPYIREYFGLYENFSDVNYLDLDKEKRRFGVERVKQLIIRDNDFSKDKLGFVVNNTKFVVHMIVCNKERNFCALRVNGVLIKVSANSEIPLTEDYTLKVDSIDYGFCDHRRFCNRHYDAYDRILMSLELWEEAVG